MESQRQKTLPDLTTEQFLKIVLGDMQGEAREQFLEESIRRGLMEPFTAADREQPLTKRRAAGILYALLQIRYGEEDEKDYSAALVLKDLFECRVCARALAQVYVKGIMEESAERVFGVNDPVSEDMANIYLTRLSDTAARLTIEKPAKSAPVVLSYEEASAQRAGSTEAVWIEVDEEVLRDVIRNPYGVCEDLFTPIYLVCDHGYRSAEAAKILTHHGYKHVFAVARG